MRNPQFWIPFMTWIISVALVSWLIFALFQLSDAVSFIYIVIIFTALYILFRTRKTRQKK